MTKRAYIDMDGVLTDFNGSWLTYLKESNITNHVNGVFETDEEFQDAFRDYVREYWFEVQNKTKRFNVINSICKYLSDEGYDIYTLSSCGMKKTQKGYGDVCVAKSTWISQHIKDFPVVNTFFVEDAPDKAKIYAREGCILIDDREDSILEWKAKNGIGFRYDDDNAIRVFKDILDYVEEQRIINNG